MFCAHSARPPAQDRGTRRDAALPRRTGTRTGTPTGTRTGVRTRAGGGYAVEPMEPRLLLAADLDVTSVTGTAASYGVQDRIRATANIANVGTFLSNSGPFHLRFYLAQVGGSSRYALIEEAHVLNVLRGVPTSDVINGLGYFIPASTPQGQYRVSVELDVYGAVAEETESNNTGTSGTFWIYRPDLQVPNVTDTAASYKVGQRIGATAHIANRGQGYASGFDLRFYLGNDANNTLYTIEDGSVFNLDHGESTTDIINGLGWAIPATVPQGQYRVYVRADSGNVVPEADEGNNLGSSAPFWIYRPDLRVTDVTGTAAYYGVGDRINATAHMVNGGLGDSDGFDLRYYLGNDANNTLYTIEDGSVLFFLNAGQAASDVINGLGWVIPADVPQGQYRVYVKVDSGEDILEADEANNFGSSSPFTVYRPDLVVTGVTGVETGYQVGDRLHATAAIKNQGRGYAGGFDLRFYLGNADGSNNTRYTIEDGSVLFLRAGQDTTDVINLLGWAIPADVPAGFYRVWVHTDVGGAVPENDEDNNWASSAQFGIGKVNSVRWEDAAGRPVAGTVDEGTPLYLAVDAALPDPAAVLHADVLEDDVLFNDTVVEDVPLMPQGGGKWRALWHSYWTDDGIGGGDPEYFFRLTDLGFDAATDSENLNVRAVDYFDIQLSEHTEGPGVPLVLVHGNGSNEHPEMLYRWEGFNAHLQSHLPEFARFDVYLWKHKTNPPIGFNGAAGSSADKLAEYVYDELQVGVPGTRYADQKVALMAHSQGGMISRAFMNAFNPDLGRKQGEDVSGLVTLGTPHHGSPLALPDWIASAWGHLFGLGAASENVLDLMFVFDQIVVGSDGDTNLAWDNTDNMIRALRRTAFPDFTFELTRRDTNAVDSTPDATLYYPDSLKSGFGTLAELNANDSFLHKLVATGAYDNDFSGNTTPQELYDALGGPSFGEHSALSALTLIIAAMDRDTTGSPTPVNYVANDGLVPLQSSLMLNLAGDDAVFATRGADDRVTLDTAAIASHTYFDVGQLVFTGLATDHQHELVNTDPNYWPALTAELLKFIETVAPSAAPADPAPGASVAAGVLNGRRYFDVTFSDAGGSGVDPGSITDAAPEFTLSGPGAAGVVVGAPTQLPNSYTYRYAFTGDFAPGAVSIEFVPGGFADDAGNESSGGSASFAVVPGGLPGVVVGRSVFYDNSAFDVPGPGVLVGDDAAIATDKAALLPGLPAGVAHYTNYTGGLNGIMVDVSGLPAGAGPTAEDFEFRAGAGGDPAGWAAAPAPAVVVRRGAGAAASDRVVLTWANGVIRNTWLQVIVKPGARTGLLAPDAFTFGNLIGDTGDDPATFRVTALDLAAVKRRLSTDSEITGALDFNRDGKVNALDVAALKQNLARTLTAPTLAPAPATAPSAALPFAAVPRAWRPWADAEPDVLG